MNSNFFDCSTGMSAGFVPLRILSTIDRDTLEGFDLVGAVGHQAALLDKVLSIRKSPASDTLPPGR